MTYDFPIITIPPETQASFQTEDGLWLSCTNPSPEDKICYLSYRIKEDSVRFDKLLPDALGRALNFSRMVDKVKTTNKPDVAE